MAHAQQPVFHETRRELCDDCRDGRHADCIGETIIVRKGYAVLVQCACNANGSNPGRKSA